MVTLAEILEINVLTNLCKVRVPLLEPAGNGTKVTMWATMILPPGIHGGYEPGDVVFVSFADNTLSRPVVLGQLYKGPGRAGNKIDKIGNNADELDRATSFSCTNLEATGTVKLPSNTIITEANSDESTTIKTLMSTLESLQSQIDTLKAQVAELEPKEEKKGWFDNLVDTFT